MKFKTFVGKNVKVNYEEIYRALAQFNDIQLFDNIDFILYGDDYSDASQSIKDHLFTKQEQKFILDTTVQNYWFGGQYIFNKLVYNDNIIILNIPSLVTVGDTVIDFPFYYGFEIANTYSIDKKLINSIQMDNNKKLQFCLNLELLRVLLHALYHIQKYGKWCNGVGYAQVDKVVTNQIKEYVSNYGIPNIINIINQKDIKSEGE